MFADEAVIEVRAGHGGPGAVSFRREKYVPRGGPDGGDGGRGGDVIFEVKENVKTLSHLRMYQHFRAKNGSPGEGRKRHGKDGSDVVITVPPGTVVRDSETDELLLDLINAGDRHVLLKGGIGGKGNTHFKSSRLQAPRFAQPGEPGEERRLRVVLEVIADVGFVGLPNAGKSTLLKVLTAADPKIGNYPFTTVIPNLGVLRRYDEDVVLADIPGIIQGASHGAGLGLRFLKHIARTSALAFVLDLTSADALADYKTLCSELAEYSRDLLRKNRLAVFTKSDLGYDPAVVEAFGNAEPDVPTVVVSAVSNSGVEKLKNALFHIRAIPEEEVAD